MYFGELAEHSYEYQCGHETGSVRAYDHAIAWFEKILNNEKANTKHTTTEFLALLKYAKQEFIHECDTFGMGIDEIEEP